MEKMTVISSNVCKHQKHVATACNAAVTVINNQPTKKINAISFHMNVCKKCVTNLLFICVFL